MPWPETWMPSRPRTPMVDYGYVRPPGHAPSWLPGTEAQRYAGHVQQTQPYSGWGGWGGMPQQQPSWSQRPMVPRPYHVNPMVWDSLGNVGQQLALGAAEQQGYDANDWLRQLNESRPQGQAPRRVRTQYAPSRGFGGF